MKLPEGVHYHGNGLHLEPGDTLPEEILAALPSDHPLKAGARAPASDFQAPRAARPAQDDKGK